MSAPRPAGLCPSCPPARGPSRFGLAWRLFERLPWRSACTAWLLAFTASAALGQSPPDEAAQRERIARERDAAQADLAAREAECRSRFVVTGCIESARRQHRERLDRLQGEEEGLDAAQRRRRAAERLASIEQKTAALAQARAPVDPAAAAASPAPAASAVRPSPGPRSEPSQAARETEAARRAAETDADRRRVRAEAVERRRTAQEAAARRAASAEERRREAEDRERRQVTKDTAPPRAAPLPPRPPLPSASAP